MRPTLKSGILISLLFALPTCTLAQSASAQVGACIVAPLQVTRQTDLEFGSIVPSARAETVAIDTGGDRKATGGIALVTGSEKPTVARFAVSGVAGASFSIVLPESTTISRVGGEAEDMTVTDFTSNPGAAGTLGPDGKQTIAIGATLHVGAAQPLGRYVGTFDVTVAYQ